jgi:hypothetical protein
MASVAPVITHTNKTGVVKATWTLAAGDTGQKVGFSMYPDKTLQVTGTFGSATLRGSNLDLPSDVTAADWGTLSDPQGVDLTFTAGSVAVIAENTLWVSPITTGGSGYVISVVGVKE